MYSITYRDATLRETKTLTQQASVDVKGWCSVVVFYALGFAVFCTLMGLAADVVAYYLGRSVLPWCTVGGAGLGVLLGGTFLYTWHKSESSHRRLAKRDLSSGRSQLIMVEDCEVVYFHLPLHDTPGIACQIDDKHVLLMWGPCLENPTTFQIDPLIAEVDEWSLSGFGGPFAFPSTRFVVTRGAETGAVMGLDIRGTARPMLHSTYTPKDRFTFDECSIFEGSIHNLAETLTFENMVEPEDLIPEGEVPTPEGTSPALRAVGADESGARRSLEQMSLETGPMPILGAKRVETTSMISPNVVEAARQHALRDSDEYTGSIARVPEPGESGVLKPKDIPAYKPDEDEEAESFSTGKAEVDSSAESKNDAADDQAKKNVKDNVESNLENSVKEKAKDDAADK